MTRGSSTVKVTWHMVRSRSAPAIPEHWIGKWLVCCSALAEVLPYCSAICVVDDFGDLVPVPMRAPE